MCYEEYLELKTNFINDIDDNRHKMKLVNFLCNYSDAKKVYELINHVEYNFNQYMASTTIDQFELYGETAINSEKQLDKFYNEVSK